MILQDILQKEFVTISNGFCQEVKLYNDIVLSIIHVNKLDVWDKDPNMIFYFVKDYVNKIESRNINVPETYLYELEGNTIYQAREFIPNSFEDKVKECSTSDELLENVESVLKVIHKLNRDVGIDPSPRNFRVKNNKLIYVDFFYPYTKEYINWKRSRIDISTEIGKKYYYASDMSFIPKVFIHLVKNFVKVNNQFNEDIMNFVSSDKTVAKYYDNFKKEYFRLINIHGDI